MDDNGHRENGRHKADHYKSVHAQWMIPPHQMKDSHAMKVMAIMAERDNAIQERNLALAEKKAALAERDMAILQRDAVVSERNTALMERDSALAALEYARESSINGDTPSAPRPSKHFHPHPPILSDMPYAHGRDLHATEAYPITTVSVKPKRPRKETKSQNPNAAKKTCSRKGKQASSARTTTMCQWRGGNIICGGEDLKQNEWKGQDLGLNLVTFDDTTMPAPTCSCTGKLQQCYKWGSGGWQSACCTTTLSMYPLPVMANKRHARVAGRKMSGSAFTKLLSRLAAEGHDLSAPVDLRYHWAKHGTNRYITIR